MTSIFVTQRMMLSSIPNNTEKHSIVKRYENITKSGGDKREVKFVYLILFFN